MVPIARDFPLTAKRRAELPARNGVAMDVPDSIPNAPSGTGNVDNMLPPGAARAGLKKKSFDGP